MFLQFHVHIYENNKWLEKSNTLYSYTTFKITVCSIWKTDVALHVLIWNDWQHTLSESNIQNSMYRYSVFKRNTYNFIYTIYTALYHIYMYIHRYTPSLAFQRITGRICFTVTVSGGGRVANEWMDQKKEVYFCNFWVLYHAP